MRAATIRAVAAAAATLTALSLGACASAGTSEPTPTPERTSTVASPPSFTPGPAASAQGTVLITIGDTTLQGQLWDNPAARDLAARLPLTFTFSEFNAVEKTARLDPPLTMDGMPAGDDPNPGEIGWYAPSSSLVLYHGDVGYWNGIARLGTFDENWTGRLASGPHDVTVTIATAAR